MEGNVLHFESDGILLLVNGLGYEVMLNPRLVEHLRSRQSEEAKACLYIYYHQTERQPKPVLIGFETLEDKEFFQTFISVSAIGPMKAVKAMTRPTEEIAGAIEKKDVSFLTGLSGIGKRTAEKIIATLHGKVERFVMAAQDGETGDERHAAFKMPDIGSQVEDVLVEQLGHSPGSARRMIKEAFEKNSNISTPEELFDEIFQEKI
jgi:Holliday junction DNA helicase RuvA